MAVTSGHLALQLQSMQVALKVFCVYCMLLLPGVRQDSRRWSQQHQEGVSILRQVGNAVNGNVTYPSTMVAMLLMQLLSLGTADCLTHR
jgi:hypothetical protein